MKHFCKLQNLLLFIKHTGLPHTQATQPKMCADLLYLITKKLLKKNSTFTKVS